MPAIKAALARADSALIVRQVQAGNNFELEVDGCVLEFEAEDIQVHTSSAQGYASSSADGCLVALDTSLNHNLVIEGIARELVRSVQDARKSAELEISDRIMLSVGGSAQVHEALQQHRDYIVAETLALDLVSESHGELEHGFRVTRSLGDQHWQIVLAKRKLE